MRSGLVAVWGGASAIISSFIRQITLDTSVTCKRFAIASRWLDDLLKVADIAIEPMTEEWARLGREAYRDFGKRSGHPAQLNFGDCFAYALAKAMGEPLFFKGDDFAQSDVTPAIERQ